MFVRPSAIVDQLDLKNGEIVIDCGAGTGVFTFLVSPQVGRSGQVIALDIQKSLVDSLVREAHNRDLHNITAFGVDLERPNGVPLKDGIADVCLLSNILFQVGDKRACLQEAVRLLRQGGRLVVVEWRDSFGGIGPHLDYIVPEELVHTLADELGLLYSRSLEAGDYQYGVIFQKL